MIPLTFIFIGRSGCGKGTQAALLENYLETKLNGDKIIHLETGKLFREFVQGSTYTQGLSEKLYKDGGLQPEFLTVHLWSDFFVMNVTAETHLIIDGTPRVLNEALILDTAINFYGRSKPYVFHIDVSRQWSETRMLERKRRDDNKHDIQKRLDWFETSVKPAIEYYRTNSAYHYCEVNGERDIQDIHHDIVKFIDLG